MRRVLRSLLTLLCASLAIADSAAAGGMSLTKGIAITVREDRGIARIAEPVTFGFPVAESEKLKKTKDLYVVDPLGVIVPSQFRVLQRWRAAPNSAKKPIRWLLVDLQIDVPANGTAIYVLKRKVPGYVPDGEAAPAPPLLLDQTTPSWVVDSGAARFQISTAHAGFLERLEFDVDGDGVLEEGEQLVDAPAGRGFVLEDRFAATYASSKQAPVVALEEAGPLRMVIRVDGAHRPEIDGAGIGRDFLRYTTRYVFYAGKPFVRVQHSLANDYLSDPLGGIGFESYSLTLPLKKVSDPQVFQAKVGYGPGVGFSQSGPLRLYQDSDGGPNWALAPFSTIQGYRVYGAAEAILFNGPQAPGWIDASDGQRGVLLVMRDFFENFPKGLGFDGDATLALEVFPKDFASFHWLDDAQRKTTEFALLAHRDDPLAPFDAASAAALLNAPLLPFCDPKWMRRTKAWADAGDLDDPPQDDAVLLAYDQDRLVDVYNQAFTRSNFAFGWSEFGEYIWAKSTHTTGSPRSRLSYFDRFAINGSSGTFRIFELWVKHSRDIRTYHIAGFDLDAHPDAVLWEGLPWSQSADKLGRDAISPSLAPHKDGIPPGGHGWNGFDIEHMVVDDLYEHYLLTGDPVSFEALSRIGQAMRTWPIYVKKDPVGSTRGIGWGLRALVKCWQVTGDERIKACANALVEVVRTTYNRKPSPVNGKVYHWVTRFPPNASHIATAEYDVPWQLAIVIHGLLLHHRETNIDTSRKIALEIADYLVDYCWTGTTMHEAVAVDNAKIFNPKPDNSGVNTWIPSALALCYRELPRPEYLSVAKKMYNSVPSLHAWNTYNGWGLYHWWHNYRALMLGF